MVVSSGTGEWRRGRGCPECSMQHAAMGSADGTAVTGAQKRQLRKRQGLQTLNAGTRVRMGIWQQPGPSRKTALWHDTSAAKPESAIALTNPSHTMPQARGVCAPNSPRVSKEVRVRTRSGGAVEARDRSTRTTSVSIKGGPANAGVGNGVRGHCCS